jgi:TATA-box binding protein (TBP) (component of TFIID and TFIIIB)|tara:strand:+ start:31 stop:822 length:792 start_codon:yes stop_codon:yes gene_type:complete
MDNKTTDYRISTITAVGNINSIIDLQQFFDIFNPTNNIVYVEYGKTKNISNVKGIHPKKKPKKKKKDSKRFDNQATVFIKLKDETYANMKIFKNGKIQMTGLKAINNGIEAINILIDYIKNIHTEKNNILDKIEDVKLTNYKICLINSDFKFEHKIRRNDLHLFITKNTGLVCSYEPCIYPGVKIQYFYNDDNDGECKCSEYCDNKKKTSKCSKITIAIFESGCTIITGAKNINQINTTYKFITDLVNNNISSFKKKELPILE